MHIHQHLDRYADGKRVTVPANIGIDLDGGFISDLHTHDSSGIMHVESPTQRDFTLGQFFAVWGLPLRETCVGGLCEKGASQLRVWVNGTEVEGDPTRLRLAEHQEIAIAYGTAAQMPDPVPESFDFAAVGLWPSLGVRPEVVWCSAGCADRAPRDPQNPRLDVPAAALR